MWEAEALQEPVSSSAVDKFRGLQTGQSTEGQRAVPHVCPQLKHGETERRMQELETAVKQLQVERDALAVKAETLERCLLQGEPGPKGVRGVAFLAQVAVDQGCLAVVDNHTMHHGALSNNLVMELLMALAGRVCTERQV